MHIVHITPELAPVAKVGNLGDFVFGLTRELELLGQNVEIVLPKYDCMRYDQPWGMRECDDGLLVPWSNEKIRCTVFDGHVHGRHCFFIEPHSQHQFFERGKFYGAGDDVERFAFFSRAAIEFIYKSHRQPDVIHCHDWQTGLVPVFLYEFYEQLGLRRTRVCFTINNFKHQGVAMPDLLKTTELGRPEYFLDPERLGDNEAPGSLNLLKGGIVYSNFVTAMSRYHAWEVMNGQGFGVEATVRRYQAKYDGVRNGLDYEVWDPQMDRLLPHRYGAHQLGDKTKNKQAIRERFSMADSAAPMVGFVGRLDPQKGFELVQHALRFALENRAQFVLMGTSPDSHTSAASWNLKRALSDCPDCHIELGYSEELAHLLLAGTDLSLMPSRYDPCGLGAMLALRYGTVPVAHAVGGFVDTVFDADDVGVEEGKRNGFLFGEYQPQALQGTLLRAIDCYYNAPKKFERLRSNGMGVDSSWLGPAQRYIDIYDQIRVK